MNKKKDLSATIRNMREELLCISPNVALTTLFWKIGTELNLHPVNSKIDSWLHANYGPYFSKKNIQKMREFAQQLPDTRLAARVALFVNWEQIPGSLSALQQHMKATAQKKPAIKSRFSGSQLASLRPLLELRKPPRSNNNLAHVIVGHIEHFKTEQNRSLNYHLNNLFWETGKEINRGASLATTLEKQYGKCFSNKQLIAMAKFARLFADSGSFASIAYLATWDQILALLPLSHQETINFYILLAAAEGLSVYALKQRVAQKAHEQYPSLKHPDISTTVTKDKNAVNVITTVYCDPGNSGNKQRAINILKNKYFLDFISHP